MPIIGANAANSDSNLGAYIQYNNYRFNSPRFRTRLQQVPEESVDGRTTLCNTYHLTVRGIITDDEDGYRAFIESAGTNSIDNRRTDQYNARSNLQKIRSRLAYKGGHLKIRGLGLDIDLNAGTQSSMFDARFGPTTRQLTFESIGNGTIWEIVWECEFSIPECTNAGGTGNAGHTAGRVNAADVSWMGFPYIDSINPDTGDLRGHPQGSLEGLVFDVGYTVDQSGLTQRVINGEFSIALTRSTATGLGAETAVPETADSSGYRDVINPPIPENFRRSQSVWRMSPDKRKMFFTIVDTELPGENAYPLGIIDMVLEHTVSVEGQVLPIAPIINCMFSGYCEVAKGYALGTALDKVVLIIQSRLDKARLSLRTANPTIQPGDEPIYITGFMLTESLYGLKRITYALNYRIMNVQSRDAITGIVDMTGLFTQNTNSTGDLLNNWTDWKDGFTTERLTHWKNRGVAKLKFTTEDDVIVGPCDSSTVPDQFGDSGDILDPVTSGGGSLSTNCPPEGKDYLIWENKLSVKTDNSTVIHQPMGTASPSGGYNGGAVEEIKSDDNAPISAAFRASDPNSPSRGSFASAGSTIRIWLRTRAVRIGRPIEIPSVNLDKFHALYDQGQLIPGDSNADTSRLGKLGKCTVYSGEVYVDYYLTGLTNSTDIKYALAAFKDALTYTISDPDGTKLGGGEDRS